MYVCVCVCVMGTDIAIATYVSLWVFMVIFKTMSLSEVRVMFV